MLRTATLGPQRWLGWGRVTVGRGGLQPDPDTPVGEREQREHRGSRAP